MSNRLVFAGVALITAVVTFILLLPELRRKQAEAEAELIQFLTDGLPPEQILVVDQAAAHVVHISDARDGTWREEANFMADNGEFDGPTESDPDFEARPGSGTSK